MFFLLQNGTRIRTRCLFMYGNSSRFLAGCNSMWIFLRSFPKFFPHVVALTTDYHIHVNPFFSLSHSPSLLPPLSFAFATWILTSAITGHNGLCRFFVSVVSLFYPFFLRADRANVGIEVDTAFARLQMWNRSLIVGESMRHGVAKSIFSR